MVSSEVVACKGKSNYQNATFLNTHREQTLSQTKHNKGKKLAIDFIGFAAGPCPCTVLSCDFCLFIFELEDIKFTRVFSARAEQSTQQFLYVTSTLKMISVDKG